MKVTQLLQGFIVSLLYNTIRKTATSNAHQGKFRIKDSYIHELQRRTRGLNDETEFNEYTEKFGVYCSTLGYHASMEDIVKKIFDENFSHSLVSQMGHARKKMFARKIFIKTFEECAVSLIKNDEILDMVANGADNALAPCKKLIETSISRVFAELKSEQITSKTTDKTQMVSIELYEKTKERCIRLNAEYNRVQINLENSIKKIEEMKDQMIKLHLMNKSLMDKIRYMETTPKVFSTVNYGQHDKDLTADDSVSCISSRSNTMKHEKKEEKEDRGDKEDKRSIISESKINKIESKSETKIEEPQKNEDLLSSFGDPDEPLDFECTILD